MSLASLLSIARSALLAQQRAMSVTAHNVANAQTQGYSRQRLELTAADPLRSTLGTLGRGVTEASLQRIRDSFFDARYRTESGLLADSGAMRDYLGEVESAMNEPSDSGVSAALDGLFGAFADLAANPSSSTSRTLLQQAGRRFVNRMHQLDTALHEVGDAALAKLRSEVDTVNQLAAQIGELNAEILMAGGPSGNAPDLQDQRDVLVDRLSSLVAVRVVERPDGSIAVTAGDTLLVDGAYAQPLTVESIAGGGFRVAAASGSPVDPQAGSIAALVKLLDDELPGIEGQLDSLVRALVTSVNTLHRSGYTLGGATGTDFFLSGGLTAGTIALAPAVDASGDAIAAGATNAPGDGAIALQLSQLATAPMALLGGKSLRDYYVDLAGTVGTGVSDASQDADVHQSMVDQADTMRSSVSGVSVDEEMVALISQQQAYSAAARVVNVANQMLQDILDMV